MIGGEMWKNLPPRVASKMLQLLGILWLIGANCNWEVIAFSSIQEAGSRKEQRFFKGDAPWSRIPQNSPPPNLPSLAHLESPSNFSSPCNTYGRRARLIFTDPPALLGKVKAKGTKMVSSTADKMSEQEDWRQLTKKRDEYRDGDGGGNEGEREMRENATMRKKSSLKTRIGQIMSVLPFLMQLWSLPGALASIKMSLLKSIFVAKLALLMLFLNALRNHQKSESELVLVHQDQHHQHYYHDYQRLEDE